VKSKCSILLLLITVLFLSTGCSDSSTVNQAALEQSKAEIKAKQGCVIWNKANLIRPTGSTEELSVRYPSLSNFAAAAHIDIEFLDLSFAAQQYFKTEFFAGPRSNFNKVEAYCFGLIG